jgi:hypothetical protein
MDPMSQCWSEILFRATKRVQLGILSAHLNPSTSFFLTEIFFFSKLFCGFSKLLTPYYSRGLNQSGSEC